MFGKPAEYEERSAYLMPLQTLENRTGASPHAAWLVQPVIAGYHALERLHLKVLLDIDRKEMGRW